MARLARKLEQEIKLKQQETKEIIGKKQALEEEQQKLNNTLKTNAQKEQDIQKALEEIETKLKQAKGNLSTLEKIKDILLAYLSEWPNKLHAADLPVRGWTTEGKITALKRVDQAT